MAYINAEQFSLPLENKKPSRQERAEQEIKAMTSDNKDQSAQHVCKEFRFCTCYSLALEPSESCPIHGCNFESRCRCGRFVAKERKP